VLDENNWPERTEDVGDGVNNALQQALANGQGSPIHQRSIGCADISCCAPRLFGLAFRFVVSKLVWNESLTWDSQ
jgi:hypothetical protein